MRRAGRNSPHQPRNASSAPCDSWHNRSRRRHGPLLELGSWHRCVSSTLPRGVSSTILHGTIVVLLDELALVRRHCGEWEKDKEVSGRSTRRRGHEDTWDPVRRGEEKADEWALPHLTPLLSPSLAPPTPLPCPSPAAHTDAAASRAAACSHCPTPPIPLCALASASPLLW